MAPTTGTEKNDQTEAESTNEVSSSSAASIEIPNGIETGRIAELPSTLKLADAFVSSKHLDLSPGQQLEKVVWNDAQQNKRISAKFNGYRASFPKCPPTNLGSNSNRSSGHATKMRFIVCSLGLISLAMSQMSRMVLNQSIGQMVVEVAKKDDVSADGSCPWPKNEETTKDEIISATTSAAPLHIGWNEKTTTTTGASPRSTTSKGSTSLPDTTHLWWTTKALPTSRPATASDAPDQLDANMEELPDFEEVLMETLREDQPADETGGTSIPATPSEYPRYNWTVRQQSVLLGGFYYSYSVFMVLGGRMAEIYGAKYVLLLAVAGSALINLATPWIAAFSFPALVMSRVVMGAIQAGVFPGMYALIAKWLTMTEANIYAPLIKMNLRLGMMLGSAIPGIVSGWTNAFYMTALLSAIWCALWLLIATSEPADNDWVSPAELERITRKKRKTPSAPPLKDKSEEFEEVELKITSNPKQLERCPSQEPAAAAAAAAEAKARSAPWLKIITAPSVIGLIVVKLTMNYALDFLVILLPSYLNNVHHVNKERSSVIMSTIFFIQVLLIVFVGWLAKAAILERPFELSKTSIRKLFQGLSSFGLSVCFFILTFNNCDIVFVTVLLQIISLLSMFAAGGETMLPYDLSEEYPATIMAIANSIANLSGVTTTTVAGLVLGNHGGSYYRWNILIYLIAAFNLVGGVAFTFLVRAEPIDFSGKDEDEKKEAETKVEGAVLETARPQTSMEGQVKQAQ